MKKEVMRQWAPSRLYRLAVDTSNKLNEVVFNYPTENRVNEIVTGFIGTGQITV